MQRTLESDDISKTCHAYIEGVKTGNIDLVKSAFHPNAIMSGLMNGNIVAAGPPTPFFSDVEHGPAQNSLSHGYAARILSVETNGDIATATIAEDNISVGQPDGSRLLLDIVDKFHLLKMDGEWKIVSKLFFHDPA
jgi:hypothetical protein